MRLGNNLTVENDSMIRHNTLQSQTTHRIVSKLSERRTAPPNKGLLQVSEAVAAQITCAASS